MTVDSATQSCEKAHEIYVHTMRTKKYKVSTDAALGSAKLLVIFAQGLTDNHKCAFDQAFRELSLKQQPEAVLLTILQTIAAYGAHLKGEKAELLVLCVLLGRIDDSDLSVRSVAAQLLLGQTLILFQDLLIICSSPECALLANLSTYKVFRIVLSLPQSPSSLYGLRLNHNCTHKLSGISHLRLAGCIMGERNSTLSKVKPGLEKCDPAFVYAAMREFRSLDRLLSTLTIQ